MVGTNLQLKLAGVLKKCTSAGHFFAEPASLSKELSWTVKQLIISIRDFRICCKRLSLLEVPFDPPAETTSLLNRDLELLCISSEGQSRFLKLSNLGSGIGTGQN